MPDTDGIYDRDVQLDIYVRSEHVLEETFAYNELHCVHGFKSQVIKM
jgi:hypothetical protein